MSVRCALLLLCLIPQAVAACEDAPICRVAPDTLYLPQTITFDDIQSGYGPGHRLDEVLPLPGAAFGEHFAGQTVASTGPYDFVTGEAYAPLSILAGRLGQNLSVVHFSGNAVLNGYGAAGFPRREAQGEGAIAVLFDADQSAFAFDLRGGEAGTVRVAFLRRDGSSITALEVQPAGEFTVAFLRGEGLADIAGFVVTNTDPQGIAIDTLRFGKPRELS
jgi:hypothetical protein